MPYTYLAQIQLTQILTPESIAAVVAGFGALTAGLGYAVRQYFEIRRINAQSIADDEKSENEQMTSLINVIREQTNVYGGELVNLRREFAQRDEKLITAMKDNTAQTAGLRQDVKALPSEMGASVAAALTTQVDAHDKAVTAKLVNIERVIEDVRQKQASHETIINSILIIINDWRSPIAQIAAIHRMLDEWDKPPTPPDDTEPDDQPPAPSKTQSKIINADAAKDNATVDRDAKGLVA